MLCVFKTNSSCFPYFISMNLPSKYGNVFDVLINDNWTSWYNT